MSDRESIAPTSAFASAALRREAEMALSACEQARARADWPLAVVRALDAMLMACRAHYAAFGYPEISNFEIGQNAPEDLVPLGAPVSAINAVCALLIEIRCGGQARADSQAAAEAQAAAADLLATLDSVLLQRAQHTRSVA
jgi:hypothetical protein